MQRLLIVFLFVIFYSCEKITSNCKGILQTNSIVDFQIDLFAINDVQVTEDELRINVSYGGGCEEHEFNLINVINPSDGGGQQIDVLYLSHNANNDLCEAAITEQLCFDISEIVNSGLLYLVHQDSLYDLN